MSFHSIRILYLTQIIPIIEFGLATIPQEPTKIEIEKMQKYSLRALTGARCATRYESILICLGLTTMETRIHQLKLMYYKLKAFDKNLYVYKIFKHKMTTESTMEIELQSIFNIHKNKPRFPRYKNFWLEFLGMLNLKISEFKHSKALCLGMGVLMYSQMRILAVEKRKFC